METYREEVEALLQELYDILNAENERFLNHSDLNVALEYSLALKLYFYDNCEEDAKECFFKCQHYSSLALSHSPSTPLACTLGPKGGQVGSFDPT